MNKIDFKKNLIRTINHYNNIADIDVLKFVLVPVVEKDAKYNSTDDYMRLVILTKENISNRLFDADGVVNILSGPNSTYPLWIDVSIVDNSTINIEFSMRFRKPSELRNKETGNSPFKFT